MTKPNPHNFCGGNFRDWLEVLLVDKCNGTCRWCIERDGYHPIFHAEWLTIGDAIIRSGKRHIVLLGGEPTLFRDLDKLLSYLRDGGRYVYISTNGSLLTKDYVDRNLFFLAGVNISIHHHDLTRNHSITGIKLNYKTLKDVIFTLQRNKAKVRLNCNCTKGYIDSEEDALLYIKFAKALGVDKVRFAELKQDEDSFVDLVKMFNYKYGLSDEPFTRGCNRDTIIDEMLVNFRLMCGLQTTKRVAPLNPEQCIKKVLYYDGRFYNGWQVNVKTEDKQMTDKELVELLQNVATEKKSVAEAAIILTREFSKLKQKLNEGLQPKSGGSGCVY